MMSLNGFVELGVDDVVWYTDAEGEPHWKPKNPEPGKSYCLLLPKIPRESFSGKSLSQSLGSPRDRK